MQCPTCGSRVPDGADVCPDCGMDLQNFSAPAPTPAEFTPTPADNAASFEDFEFDNSDELLLPPDNAPISLDKSGNSPVAVVPAQPTQSATLTLKRGGALTAEKFVIGAMASIGRFDPESGPVDVDMANLPEASYVSRHHAEIRCDGEGWHIRDLGSRNGTFVRAASGGAFARVQGEHALSDGDEVSLGNARFEFRCAN